MSGKLRFRQKNDVLLKKYIFPFPDIWGEYLSELRRYKNRKFPIQTQWRAW